MKTKDINYKIIEQNQLFLKFPSSLFATNRIMSENRHRLSRINSLYLYNITPKTELTKKMSPKAHYHFTNSTFAAQA